MDAADRQADRQGQPNPSSTTATSKVRFAPHWRADTDRDDLIQNVWVEYLSLESNDRTPARMADCVRRVLARARAHVRTEMRRRHSRETELAKRERHRLVEGSQTYSEIDLRIDLEQAMANLPIDDLEVVCRAVNGMAISDIASELNCSASKVYRVLEQCKATLRKALK